MKEFDKTFTICLCLRKGMVKNMKYHKKVGTTTIIVITLFAFLYISNLVYQNVKSSNSSNQISAKQITSTHNKITQGLTVYMLPVINEMRPMQKNVVHLTQISTTPQLNGNKFTYGTLLVDLPDGVTIEQRRSEGIYNVVDFINTKNDENKENSAFHNAPFPPRIWIAHYQADYPNGYMQGSQWAVASALLDILPDTALTLKRYVLLEDACRFGFTFFDETQRGYVIVCNNEVYLIQETYAESYDNFGILLKNDAVKCLEDNDIIGGWEKCFDYDTINDNCQKVEQENSYLLVKDKGKLYLYQDGYFERPYQTLLSDINEYQQAIIQDCNFDKYPDVVVGNSYCFWNPLDKIYECAELPEDFPRYYMQYFPDSKTIWSFDKIERKGVADDDTDYQDWIEVLWKWDHHIPVIQRKCVAQIRDNTVRIYAYEGNHCLFDASFLLEQWEQGNSEIQTLYKQFYQGMASERTYGILHKVDKELGYIPQAFLDNIADEILGMEELEMSKEKIKGKQLTREEGLAIAAENISMRCEIAFVEKYGGSFEMVMTDLDNDGILDIISEEYGGGTGGFTYYNFYKGNRDGTYQQTDGFDAVQEEFAVLSYGGKNYLYRKLYDYDKKIWNGVNISYFEEGRLTESADLIKIPFDYNIKLIECKKNPYQAHAEWILQNSHTYKKAIDEYKIIDGSGEQLIIKEGNNNIDKVYRCDLNNDGTAEEYTKYIWLPSNIATIETLMFQVDNEAVNDNISEVIYSTEGRPIMMWVDTVQGENIIHVIALTGLDDFEITGFAVHGEDYEMVYRIGGEAVYGIKQTRTLGHFS